jgi:hypothetical protein
MWSQKNQLEMLCLWQSLFLHTVSQAANKQLQRTVRWHRGTAASAPFHYALAARFTRHRAAAELRRSAPFETSSHE